jgi:F-type H+-transporting ATPase subunit gamma
VATLKELRSRIRTVKNTKKITYAMKLVAAARLKRAQDMITAARPYAVRMNQVISSLAARAEADVHPLLEVREPKNVLVLTVTSDRGLCAGFNANIIRKTEAFMREKGDSYESMKLAVVGRKGQTYFGRRDLIEHYFPDVFLNLDLARAHEIGEYVVEAYLDHKLDEVLLVYNEFKSAISQEVVVDRLLPMTTFEERDAFEGVDYIYEPSRAELLDQLIPRYIDSQIYRALLESWASEMGARMTAMENATKNAGEIVDKLTLQMNRARQAAITTELVEITSGAQALHG